MKRSLYLLAAFAALAACDSPVTTSKRTVTEGGNGLLITSGTTGGGRFVSVDNPQKSWEGDLKGGREKWGARRDVLHDTARNEIERICGEWFVAIHKGPVYNMLDNDETMGGAAPALGVAVSMAAYLAAEAATKDTNIPTGVYMEFSCQGEGK